MVMATVNTKSAAAMPVEVLARDEERRSVTSVRLD